MITIAAKEEFSLEFNEASQEFLVSYQGYDYSAFDSFSAAATEYLQAVSIAAALKRIQEGDKLELETMFAGVSH